MKSWYRKHPQSTNASTRRRKKAIREFIQRAKNKPCTDCRLSYPYYVMDFDHVRGRKLLNLSVAVNKLLSLKKVEAEIKKCEVVCANCHRERTFTRSCRPTRKTRAASSIRATTRNRTEPSRLPGEHAENRGHLGGATT
jgi:hypothetical protein